MDDRSVEFPQRYQLKKVEGTDDIYDLIPAPGRVDAEGTLINKKALLQDSTAKLFQLSGDTALPDRVFEILSKAALVGEEGFSLPDGSSMPLSRVQSGSYTGTGTNGSSNKNSITASFDVKILCVSRESGYQENKVFGGFPWVYGQTTGASKLDVISGSTPRMYGVSLSFEGTTVKWNSQTWEGADTQLNESGVKYYWVAFG